MLFGLALAFFVAVTGRIIQSSGSGICQTCRRPWNDDDAKANTQYKIGRWIEWAGMGLAAIVTLCAAAKFSFF